MSDSSSQDRNDKMVRHAPVQNRLINLLYGDISVEEFKKFGMLGLIFLFIIGSYWLLRPLKDAVFFTVSCATLAAALCARARCDAMHARAW